MAGVEGFEPSNAGTKNRCLTAWRHPKDEPILRDLPPRFKGEIAILRELFSTPVVFSSKIILWGLIHSFCG